MPTLIGSRHSFSTSSQPVRTGSSVRLSPGFYSNGLSGIVLIHGAFSSPSLNSLEDQNTTFGIENSFEQFLKLACYSKVYELSSTPTEIPFLLTCVGRSIHVSFYLRMNRFPNSPGLPILIILPLFHGILAFILATILSVDHCINTYRCFLLLVTCGQRCSAQSTRQRQQHNT
jgi:hypothetical protein